MTDQFEPLSIADIFNAAESDNTTSIAEGESLRQEYIQKFDFDPDVSLWDESDLRRKKKEEALAAQLAANQKELAPVTRTPAKAKATMDDWGKLAAISTGIGSLNKNMSINQIEDKILSITPKLAPNKAPLSKKYQEAKNRKPKVYGPDVSQQIIKMARKDPFDKPKVDPNAKPEKKEPEGNRLFRGVKRGWANVVQTGALMHDMGYLATEKVLEAAGGKNVGQPLDSGFAPTENKVFLAMEKLKNEKYQVSEDNEELMEAAGSAAKAAEADGDNGTVAALRYLAQNGDLGNFAEIMAEMVPSLGMGIGIGSVARRGVGAAAERLAAKKVGSLASRAGEAVDAARLAKFVAPIGGAIQGGTMAASTDFIGSAGSEYSRAYNEGKNMGEGIDYALRRSLAQAGVSGLGGALLPISFGNMLYTSVGQSVVQGVAGYASAKAGAAAVGEELDDVEGALNILMGAITALPEVVAVGAGQAVSKASIIRDVEGGLLEEAVGNLARREDTENMRAVYTSGVLKDIVQQVKESKTAGRSEQMLRDFVNEVREENDSIDSVYVDVEQFNQTLTKHGVPLEDLFEMVPKLRQQWEKVEDVDGMIRIPLDELLSMAYKVDNDPMIQDVLNILRAEPNAPNNVEATASLQRGVDEIEVDVNEVIQNYKKIRVEQDENAKVQQLIKDDLNSLDFGFEKKTGYNEQAATLVGAMYDTLSKKLGITARELYDRMPVRIVSNEAEAAAVLGGMGADSFNQSGERSLSRDDFQAYIKDKYSIDLGLTGSDSSSVLTLQKIIVPDSARGTGVGTQAMNEIIAYADANNKRIALTPSSDFGGNKKRLIDFYKRFGFVENKGKNKDFEISEAMYRDASEKFNQSNDPQVELRKIYGYRDSHLAPDADGGRTADNLADVYPDLNSRNFTKDHGDGFKYDAKAVKVIRDMQKNPDMDVTVYRTVPKDANGVGLNFGDWITLTREYADEHGQARFDGDYRVIEQKVKARDIYTDGNSIHEWGYSPVADPVYKARKELAKSLEDINKKLDQALYQSRVKISDVLGDKGELKNNPALAKNFLDSKQVEISPVVESSNVSDEVAAILPEIKGLEFNSDIKSNPDLLDRAFNALFISDLNRIINSPNESDLSKSMAAKKINRFSNASDDQKFNLIDNKLSSVKNMKDGVNEAASRSAAVDQAKAFGPEYDQYIDNFLRNLGLDYYNQTEGGQYRGQIQFRKDRKGAVIIMGKDANFSTFAHEIGHHFLELNMMFSMREDAPPAIREDMDIIMKWAGYESIEDWNSLTPEQKTEVHEKFAESFELYMFTGKAPSNSLRQVFARFRSFMTAVYRSMSNFMGGNERADLNPEITAVMDRMLATEDAILEVQRQRNLEMLMTEEMARDLGISDEDYAAMKQTHEDATEAAINELEQKTIKDLAWYRNLRSKHIAAFTAQAKRVRNQIRESMAAEVAKMPVYQALAFLRQPVEKEVGVKRDANVVDPARDNLLEAITKMGGIDAVAIAERWGVDEPESYKFNVGRIKKLARKGGMAIDDAGEKLAELGYLPTDEYGRFDDRAFEDLFTDSLSGAAVYSNQADYELVNHAADYGLALGEMGEFPTAAKLNLEWIAAKYGEDSVIYKAIPNKGRYALAAKGGFDPELIAERFGFDSADKMIREIVDAPAPKDLIEQRSNEILESGYSDLFDENSINQAVDEAVHNDIRSQMLSRELAAVAKMQGRHAELNAAAKAVAHDIIAKSQIRDIRPSVFSATELRLSRQYDKALRSGDTVEAARIKRSQLINFHATRRAYEVQNQIRSLGALEKTIFGSDERLAKARDFNYVSIARFVLASYDLSDRNASYRKELEAVREYDPAGWAELSDMISTTALPEYMDYRDLTHEDFQIVDDTVRQIWYLSKEKQKFIYEGKRVDKAQIIEELDKQLDTKPKRSRIYRGPGSSVEGVRKFGSGFLNFLARLRRAEQFVTWLDDGKSNGPFHKYVFNPIQDALAQYRKAQRDMKKEMMDIYSSFDMRQGRVDAPEINFTFESKQELIHAILHSGNESNKRRLVLGREWGDELETGGVDYSKWDGFVNRMMNEGTITKNDMDAVQRIWDLFDGYKKEAQKVHKRINGRYFEELENQPINTPYGEYKGGYIPADYDPVASANADIRAEKSNAEAQKEQIGFATTGANFTKSRASNFSDILLLDLTRLPMHMDKELRYIHLEEQVRQVGSVLRSRDFRRNLEGVAPYVKEIMDDWLTGVATQQVYKPSGSNLGDRFVEGLKRHAGIVLMAGNVKNAIETWTSIPQVLVAVPAKHLAVSSAKYMANIASRESMAKDVRNLSEFMDTRLDVSGQDFRYQIENMVMNPNFVKKSSDWVKQHAYILQRITQTPIEVISWHAAFTDGTNKGMSQKDAVHHADGVIRQYLNDMNPEGVSSVERGSPIVRAMLMFYGWFNMVGNSYVTKTKLINESSASALSKGGQHIALYAMMMAFPAILAKALTQVFNGSLFDNEDEEDWDADLTNIFVHSQAEMMMGMLPFVREPANFAYRGAFHTSRYIDRYSPSPVLSMSETLFKAGKTGVKLGKEFTGDEETEVDKSKATKELLQAATFATGIPFTLVQRPAVYTVDVLVDEDQEPENAAQLTRGLISGN